MYKDAIAFIYPYLKQKKQGAKPKKIRKVCLGCWNHLYPKDLVSAQSCLTFFGSLANFTDGDTISTATRDIDKLTNLLKKESEIAIN